MYLHLIQSFFLNLVRNTANRLESIFTVPPSLRNRSKDDQPFEPEFISIGPFHHGKPHLIPMEIVKQRFFRDFLTRSGWHRLSGLDKGIEEMEKGGKHSEDRVLWSGFDEGMKEMKKCEKRASLFYAKKGEIPTGESLKEHLGYLASTELRRQWTAAEIEPYYFAYMLLIDGCFIIEYLIKYFEAESWDGNRVAGVDGGNGSTLWKMPRIGIDLLLIENQIPFFVLQALFDVYRSRRAEDSKDAVSLPDLAVNYISAGETKKWQPEKQHRVSMGESSISQEEKSDDILHLLHLYHLWNSAGLPSREPNPSPCWTWLLTLVWNKFKGCIGWFLVFIIYILVYTIMSCRCGRRSGRTPQSSTKIPCAKELWEAGVQFKRKEEGSRFSWSFKDGVLSIPRWHIDKRTKTYFWNLMAFQRCEAAHDDFFQFAIFMSYLLCSKSDVSILEKEKIVQNNLGSSEELIKFFKDLTRDGMPHQAREIFKHIIPSYESSHRQRRAKMASDFSKLVSNYNNPWVIASIVVACLLIAVSITQAAFSILKYYHSP